MWNVGLWAGVGVVEMVGWVVEVVGVCRWGGRGIDAQCGRES